MTAQEILKFLLDLGITPLEIVTLVAVIVLYRDNRLLFARVVDLENKTQERN